MSESGDDGAWLATAVVGFPRRGGIEIYYVRLVGGPSAHHASGQPATILW
jgi:hypothetical protein